VRQKDVNRKSGGLISTTSIQSQAGKRRDLRFCHSNRSLIVRMSVIIVDTACIELVLGFQPGEANDNQSFQGYMRARTAHCGYRCKWWSLRGMWLENYAADLLLFLLGI
jgi:hypothetical protein